MKKNKISALILGAVILTGCSAPKDVAYLQDTAVNELTKLAEKEDIRLRPGDKIQIIVNSKDPALVGLFNLPYVTRQIGTDYSHNQGIAGYSIDKSGNINFPVLGKIHIAGLTREQVAEKIQNELHNRDLAKDAIVTVEFQNLSVSVLGEVNRPGVVTIDRDNVTIFDALSKAGDLTINGKRNTVKVTRNEGGVQHTYLIDLTSAEKTFGSPVFYLQQGDIVYVEPNEKRRRDSSPSGNTVYNPTFWVSVASALASVVSVIVVMAVNFKPANGK